MAQYDGVIRIGTKINTNGIDQGISGINKSLGKIGKNTTQAISSLNALGNSVKKLGSVIATAFAAKQIIQFGKEATRLGSELQEVENIVSVAFPNMTKAMNEFAASASKNFGLSETMAKRYSSLFGTMAKQFGFAEKEAFEMGTTLTGLAGDVASFYDITQDEAYTKLKSVFSGETETLKDIGVVMTEAALNQYALANGIEKTVNKMTEQEKVALRYRFVLERLSQASGDFIRTSDSWANQTRVLKLQFDSLKATLGQGLINILTPVLKMINALIAKLNVLAQSFKAFTELITGNKASSGKGAGLAGVGTAIDAGQDTIPGLGDDYNTAASGAENLASATEDAAEATKEAEKAAKGYLSPLDEIHKIGKEDIEVPEIEKSKTPDTEAVNVATGGLMDAVQDIDYGNLAEGETILGKISDIFDAIIERAKALSGIFKRGFFEGLGDYKPVLEGIKQDVLSIGKTLKEIFTDPAVLSAATQFGNQLALTLGQVTGSVASIGLTIAANLIGGIEKYLTQNKERIKNYIVEMFDIGTDILKIIGDLSVALADIFSVFGGETAQQITGNLIGIFAEVGMMISENAAKLGRDILNMIAQPIIDNKEKIKNAIEGTLEAIEPFTSGLLTAVQTVRDAVTQIYDQHLKPLFDSVADGLSEIFGKLLDGYNEYIVPVLKGLGERFKELMEGPFGEAIDKVKNFIGKLIDALRLLWEEVLVPLFSWIAENIVPILADVVEFIGGNVLNVLEFIIEAVGNIADVLSGVIDFIVGVFTGDWEKAWEGVKEIFSGIWELIKGVVSGAWNAIKSIISGGIKIVADVLSAGWEGIKSVVSTAWELIKNIISAGIGVVKAVMNALGKWLNSDFSKGWSESFGVFGGVAEGFFKNIKNIFDSVKQIFNGVIQFISGVFAGNWKQAWEGIKQTFSGIWDSFVAIVKAPINLIIGALNGLLRGVQTMQNGIVSALNQLRIDIPDWLQGLTGYSSIGFNLWNWTAPQIPYLAQGTVVPPNKEFMAVLGDNTREHEVVSPLSTIKEANKEALLEVLSALGLTGGGGNGETIVVKLVVDGRTLADVVVNEGKVRQMSTGQNMFALGGI